MTRDEARNEAARLQREHPDRDRFTWLTRDDDAGGWEVVKLSLPPSSSDVRTATQPAPVRPHPSQTPPPEPRPWWGGPG